MSKSIIIDTNLLLDDPEIIFKLSQDYDTIVFPITVVKELDKHKHNKDLAYSARAAIRNIIEFRSKYPSKIKFEDGDLDTSVNDQKIITAAINNNSKIATKDLSMSVIASSKNVDVILYSIVEDRIHDSVSEITQEDMPHDMRYLDLYEGSDYNYFCGIVGDLSQNFSVFDTCFVIIDCGEKELVYANNPITRTVERIDNKPRYRKIKVDKDVDVKAQDNHQICAIYTLYNTENVLLTGKWGSGKTLLATAFALANIKEGKKIFITRPPIGIDKRYDIGLLPGSKEEKLIEWFSGIISAMYYLYSNTRGQHSEGVSFDYVKDEIFYRKFEAIPINAIQGLSLLEDDILIVDECQLISIDYFSMILSRASAGSKVILMGDYNQTYDVVRPSESGLLKLCRLLPHSAMGHVNLKTSFRSNLIELADLLSQKNL